jgi:putative alpha-1,2-mannosidase
MVYTALYHSMLAPSLFMDRDGRYRGPDNEVHQARASATTPPSRCGIPTARCIPC